MDLSGIQLAVGPASVLSDVFTIEWGLRKLVFKECDLDEHVRDRIICLWLCTTDLHLQILKPILHALLIPDSLTFLSVASNRRLKASAFRLIGAYLSKVRLGSKLNGTRDNPSSRKACNFSMSRRTR